MYKLENLSKTVGKPVYIKDESLQHTSSFKLRGVYYCIHSKIKNLIEEGKLNKRLYITTQSTGNHGIATLYSIYKILEENVFEKELKLLDSKTILEPVIFSSNHIQPTKLNIMFKYLEKIRVLIGRPRIRKYILQL